MKILDIAFKDMLRYFRSAFALGMMVVIPLLITGLIYAAFGGVLESSETEAYTLPEIKVQVANLDRGDPQSQMVLGQVLVDALTSEAVKDVFTVTIAGDEAAARAAVDRQEAAVALIVPQNFTSAAVSGAEKASLTLYQDPTLSFGPGITREIVGQFLDAFTGGQVAVRVLGEQFSVNDRELDPAAVEQLRADFNQWFLSTTGSKEWNLPVVKRLPNRETPKSISDHRTTLLGPVMAGMLIFFVFFTGANTSQSILTEQEEGTLARLFTTPTPLPAILGGKFAATLFTLVVQSVVLVAASALVFQINWGSLAALAVVIVGLVISSAGLGIFLISLAKSSRQAGVMTGGVLAIMGMASGLYTTGFNGGPAIFDTIGMALPQGWALRGMKLVLAGAAPLDVLAPLAAMLAFGAVFFILGTRTFRSRFA